MGETRGQETYLSIFKQRLELGSSSFLKMLAGEERDLWWVAVGPFFAPLFGSGGDLHPQYGHKLSSRCQSCPLGEI